MRDYEGEVRTLLADIYCTCGWKHTYKTREKAARRSREHQS